MLYLEATREKRERTDSAPPPPPAERVLKVFLAFSTYILFQNNLPKIFLIMNYFHISFF